MSAFAYLEALASTNLDGDTHSAETAVPPKERVLWRNAFGEPVDLDNIDREYALNILSMVLVRRGRMATAIGLTGIEVDADLREDKLVQKLRDNILRGATKSPADRLRAIKYNVRAKRRGLRFRAQVR